MPKDAMPTAKTAIIWLTTAGWLYLIGAKAKPIAIKIAKTNAKSMSLSIVSILLWQLNI